MNSINNFLATFGMGLALDLLFTWYVVAAANNMKLKAAVYSVGAAAVSVFGTISIYETRWLAVPYFFGLFCGTLLALSLKENPTPKRSRVEKQLGSED